MLDLDVINVYFLPLEPFKLYSFSHQELSIPLSPAMSESERPLHVIWKSGTLLQIDHHTRHTSLPSVVEALLICKLKQPEEDVIVPLYGQPIFGND